MIEPVSCHLRILGGENWILSTRSNWMSCQIAWWRWMSTQWIARGDLFVWYVLLSVGRDVFFLAKNFRSWARFWCVMCSVYRYLICLNLIFWQAPLSFSGNFGLLGVLSGRGYSTNHEADLVVIGSGPGGYVAAIKAAQLGLKVSVSFGVVILILSCVRVCSSSQLYNWWCPIDSVQL